MPAPTPSFAGLPRRDLPQPGERWGGVDVALFGADHGSPDQPGTVSHAAGAPAALRRGAAILGRQLNQFDFDIGRTLVPADRAPRIADCGDVRTDPAHPEANRAAIEASTRAVLGAGAAPLILGGDDSVPIPAFRAYEAHGPISILQIDAHVDWADTIRGNPYGYGSPMRRAAELGWVTHMVQVGLRGLGSGTEDQHRDARGWGSRLVTMAALRRDGLGPVLEAIPADRPCFVSLDLDGLDPGTMPAVEMPTPGGLDYGTLTDLLAGAAARTRLIGAAVVEFVPARDRDGLAAGLAARIALTLAGLMSRPA